MGKTRSFELVFGHFFWQPISGPRAGEKWSRGPRPSTGKPGYLV